MQLQYRQGDIFLLQVDELPSEAVELQVSDRIVLAWGETTGHAHAIDKHDARFYFLREDNYLVVEEKAKLVHEEHDSIPLPAGIFKVVRQQEYDPIRGFEYVTD